MTKSDGSVCAPMTHKEDDRLDVMIELIFRYTYNVCHNKTGASDLLWLMSQCNLGIMSPLVCRNNIPNKVIFNRGRLRKKSLMVRLMI